MNLMGIAQVLNQRNVQTSRGGLLERASELPPRFNAVLGT
jgi:hypothetical protein